MPDFINTIEPGRRLLPVVIDEIASSDPDRAWASIPISSTLSDGYRDVSYSSFANAINRAAWLLESTFGHASNFEAFAYIGKSDMRYHIMSMAAAKTGYQVLFSSHINSLTAHLNLMQVCKCQGLVSAIDVDVADILSARPMKNVLFPELDELLNPTPVDDYPFPKTFEQACNDPFLILHSSGTTGLPKPIRVTHGTIAANDLICSLPEESDCGGPRFRRMRLLSMASGRIIFPFAPFHVMSSIGMIVFTVFGKATYIFGLPDRSLDADEWLDVINYARADKAMFPPGMLDKYALSEPAMARLKQLCHLMYGGGPLASRTSQALKQHLVGHTLLTQHFGASETGWWCLYYVDAEDLEYLSIDACHMGLEWRPVNVETASHHPRVVDDAVNGDTTTTTTSPPVQLYEPVFVRGEDASHQAIFQSFPDRTEYATGDMFSPHPTRPATWKHAGRIDDLILFSHGVKYRPASVEEKLQSSHPWIQNVIMWGDGHEQAVLLVELTDEGLGHFERGDQAAKGFAIELDRAVAQINEEVPVIAQIAATHILFATREKPLPRTPKGTVRRREAARVYKDEIDEVYRKFGDRAASMMTRVR